LLCTYKNCVNLSHCVVSIRYPLHLCINKQNNHLLETTQWLIKQNKLKQNNFIKQTNKQSKMKKIIIATTAILGFATASYAQTNASGTASQTIQLSLSNALEISFTGTGSATGGTVTLPFTTVNDYANGVASSAQEIKVRSNKNFGVTVKTSTTYFNVTNNGVTTVSTMPANVLGIMVTANATGGTIGTGFSASAYNSLSATAANLINNASFGGNQTFSVQYKATPGFAYPAGTYTTDVVYTATQQ
jgi:hypothetical protein